MWEITALSQTNRVYCLGELISGGGEGGDGQTGEMSSVSEDVKCYREHEAVKGTGMAEWGHFKWEYQARPQWVTFESSLKGGKCARVVVGGKAFQMVVVSVQALGRERWAGPSSPQPSLDLGPRGGRVGVGQSCGLGVLWAFTLGS